MQQAGGRLPEGKNSKNEAVQQVVGAVESMSPAGRAVTGGAKDAQGVIRLRNLVARESCSTDSWCKGLPKKVRWVVGSTIVVTT